MCYDNAVSKFEIWFDNKLVEVKYCTSSQANKLLNEGYVLNTV